MQVKGYSITTTTDLDFDAAREKVTEELKKQGFGVLTFIDVQETMKKKIDKDMEKYVILGACNPRFASEALDAEPEIGLMLPCNVIVYQQQGVTHVAAFNPAEGMAVVDNPNLAEMSEKVTAAMKTVIASF